MPRHSASSGLATPKPLTWRTCDAHWLRGHNGPQMSPINKYDIYIYMVTYHIYIYDIYMIWYDMIYIYDIYIWYIYIWYDMIYIYMIYIYIWYDIYIYMIYIYDITYRGTTTLITIKQFNQSCQWLSSLLGLGWSRINQPWNSQVPATRVLHPLGNSATDLLFVFPSHLRLVYPVWWMETTRSKLLESSLVASPQTWYNLDFEDEENM